MTADFPIKPVLEHYGWTVPEKRGWYTIKCGYHDDSRASCRINIDKGIVACMACEIKGSAIDVVKFMEGVEYKDAVRRCEELTGTRRQRVHETSGSDRFVSKRSGSVKGNSKYVPPRLRQGSSRGT